ncbi:MAG: CoA pyrophosphatase [Deferribacterales bacterium]
MDNCKIQHVEKVLSSYKRRVMAATPRTAAVLLLLVPEAGNGCSVILTKRLRSLEHHGGEVSFPGGISEAEDATLAQTALREAREEIGIHNDKVRVIGALDDELSRWGHRVTPFVGLSGDDGFHIQQSEVERLYKVPMELLAGGKTYWTEKWFRRNEGRTVHFYRYENDIIWGLTALILNKFINISMSRA